MSLRRLAAAAVMTIVLAAHGAGLRAQQPFKEGDLANIRALKCTFSTSTVSTWKDGVPEPRIRTSGTLTIQINEINAGDGTAVIGSASAGSADINVQVYGWNMHFLEVGRGGRLGITTVFAQYTTGERLKAIHSRTDYLPIDLPGFRSEPEVAMYFGDCEATR